MIRLLLGAVLISFAGVWVALTAASPTTAAFYRMVFAGIALVLWVSWRREWERPDAALVLVLATAAAAFGLDLFFWHQSIRLVGPGLATLVVNFQVFVLALAGVVFFGERPGWRLAVAIPAALIGLALIVGPERWSAGGDFRHGVILALLAALSYAGYILALRHSRAPGGATRGSALVNMAVLCFFCAVVLGLLCLYEGESLAIPTGTDAGILVVYGLTAQVAGWVLISRALERVPASRVGLVLLLQPTLAFIWDVWFFDRGVSLQEAVGAGIALVAIYLGAVPRRAESRASESGKR